jgi:hypothetical protein
MKSRSRDRSAAEWEHPLLSDKLAPRRTLSQYLSILLDDVPPTLEVTDRHELSCPPPSHHAAATKQTPTCLPRLLQVTSRRVRCPFYHCSLIFFDWIRRCPIPDASPLTCFMLRHSGLESANTVAWFAASAPDLSTAGTEDCKHRRRHQSRRDL